MAVPASSFPGKDAALAPAELQRGQPGGNPSRAGPNPLRSQREAKGSPKPTWGHCIAHSDCLSPAVALGTGLAVRNTRDSPHHKATLPQACPKGKDCLAQHPTVPPCQHRAGMGLYDPHGTGWVYLNMTWQVPMCSHVCP